jgi:hypothetical protein
MYCWLVADKPSEQGVHSALRVADTKGNGTTCEQALDLDNSLNQI